jgi:hypothetical protein
VHIFIGIKGSGIIIRHRCIRLQFRITQTFEEQTNVNGYHLFIPYKQIYRYMEIYISSKVSIVFIYLVCVVAYSTMTDFEMMNSPVYDMSSPTYEYASDDTPVVDATPMVDFTPVVDAPPVVEVRGNFADDRSRYDTRRNDTRRGSARGSSRRHNNRHHSHASREIVDALKKKGSPVSERRLGRWFPDVNISQILIRCKNVRFTRDKTGVRCWEYESDRDVENDVYDAVDDGLSTLGDIQRRVRRRFAVVRCALDSLVGYRKKLTRSDSNGEPAWHTIRS